MIKMIMYSTSKELEELTGLDHDGLWNAGFNLDDWDVGFQCDSELQDDWLMWQLKNYGVGCWHVVCNGMHYYMAYHS